MNFVDKLFKVATECTEVSVEDVLKSFMDSIKETYDGNLPSSKDLNEQYFKYLKDNKIERIYDDKGDVRFFKHNA
jgi:hypothetical protein